MLYIQAKAYLLLAFKNEGKSCNLRLFFIGFIHKFKRGKGKMQRIVNSLPIMSSISYVASSKKQPYI